MTRAQFKRLYRIARMGGLGTLAFSAAEYFDWFLTEVYDVRFPHVGDSRHNVPRSFDPLRVSTANRLAWRRQKDYARNLIFCKECKRTHHQDRYCFEVIH